MAGLMSILTAGELASLRETQWMGNQYISLCPNATVMKTTVATIPAGNSIASFTYGAITEGAANLVRIGHTILISETDDRRAAYFRGRVRTITPGTYPSGTLYINETAATITPGDYVWVIDDHAIHEVLGIEVAGVQYKDWDRAFGAATRPRPVIYGLASAYVDWVDPATGYYQIAFNPNATAYANGATINAGTWEWSAVDGVYVVGTSATRNPTIRFPPGFRWVRVSVDDSTGREAEFWFPVWAHAPDPPPGVTWWGSAYLPELGFMGAEITGAHEAGWTATVEAFDGVDAVLDQTLAVIWVDQWYGNTHTDVRSNVQFVGRLRTERDPTEMDEVYTELSAASFDLEGPMAQLARLPMQPITLRDVNTPTEWDEITNLNLQRAIVHVFGEHSTFLSLHALEFDGYGSFYAHQLDTQGDNLMDVVRDFASAANGFLEMDAQGRARVSRDARYLDAVDRAALDTVADLEMQDTLGFEIEHEHARPVGQAWASGAAYNTTLEETAPVMSVAYGTPQGPGSTIAQLHGQVLVGNVAPATAQGEINQRCGDHLAASAPPPARTTHQLPDGYHSGVFAPSRRQWFTWAIAASDNIRGLVQADTNRQQLVELTFTHDNERGGCDVTAIFEMEQTYHPDGQTYDPGDADLPDYPYTPPYLPPVTEPLNPLGLIDAAQNDISAFSYHRHMYLTGTFQNASPVWTDTDLSAMGLAGTVMEFCVDAFSPGYIAGAGAINGWLVTSTGIYRITDIFGAVGVTLQHTFSATTDAARNIDASFAEAGFVTVASFIPNSAAAGDRGTWIAYTTDGINWTEYRLTSATRQMIGFFTPPCYMTPGVYVSSKTAGLVYVSTISVTSNCAPTVALYRSTNYGASFATTTALGTVFNYSAGTQLAFPYPDNASETMVYHGNSGSDNCSQARADANRLYKTSAGASINISPTETISGTVRQYGPAYGRWGISVSAQNKNRVFLGGIGFRTIPGGDGRYTPWVSPDGGGTWTSLAAPATNELTYTRGAIAGDDDSALFLWGGSTSTGEARIGYSANFGATISSKLGNLNSVLSARKLVGICGGLS